MTLKEFAESIPNTTRNCIAEKPITEMQVVDNVCLSLANELGDLQQNNKKIS